MDFLELEEHELKRKLGVGTKEDEYISRILGLSKK